MKRIKFNFVCSRSTACFALGYNYAYFTVNLRYNLNGGIFDIRC